LQRDGSRYFVAAPEQTSTDAGTLEGELKMVAARFADVTGSTELMAHLDPEACAIIDRALKPMIDAALLPHWVSVQRS
jgi:class 3 adenylate cyclase